MKRDKELLQELSEAVSGLWVMSESDYPFEVVGPEEQGEPSPEYLRRISGAPADAPVETRSVDDFFNSKIYYAPAGDRLEESPARSSQNLLTLLKESLTELRVYRVGTINIAVFILGKSREGNWLGLSTRVVET